MTPETFDDIKSATAGPIRFLYHEDRESPWLLTHLLPGPARIAEIRRVPIGKLLDRPRVRPVVARCGRGVLDPRDLDPAVDPEAALAPGTAPLSTSAARAGLTSALAVPSHDYSLSLSRWGADNVPGLWRYEQMSRRGVNLVLQLNFPESHRTALEDGPGMALREVFECDNHPISRSDVITMAWARIDLDFGDGEALIEEVQSDWFYRARRFERYWMAKHRKHRRILKYPPVEYYLKFVMSVYEAQWKSALLLAALCFLTGNLGLRRIYLHRPASGARLKGIPKDLPPVSLYSDLPQRFCFEPTDEAPVFLMRDRGKAIRNLRRSGRPVFWRLEL